MNHEAPLLEGRGAADDVWRYCAETESAMARHVTQALIEVCRLRPDNLVLDVACGGGNPSESLARLVREGAVFAIDTDEGHVFGLARAASLKRTRNLFVCRASAERLPFANDTFDVATCRFGIMFFSDVARALLEMRRVLRPGASAAFALFGPKSHNSLYAAIEDAFADIHVAAAAFSGLLFRLSRPGQFEGMLEGCGLRLADRKEVTIAFPGAAPRHFLRHILRTTYATPLKALSDDAKRAFAHALDARLAAAMATGSARASYRVIEARRPRR